jgi:hypothetical protein
MNTLASLAAKSAATHVTLTFSLNGQELQIDLRPLTAAELDTLSGMMAEVVPPMMDDGLTPNPEDPKYLERREAVVKQQQVTVLDLSCRGGVEGEDMAAKQAWVKANLSPALLEAIVHQVLGLSRDSVIDRANFSTPVA